MVFNFVATLLLALAFLAPESPRGTVPRSAATDYAAHASQDNMQIGASLLSHKELKKIFATDVNQCCLVVEVAVYPPKDNPVKLSLDDFMLREAGMELGTRPSLPETLAARLEVQPTAIDREHQPGVTSGSDIGYERTTEQNGTSRTSSGGVVQRSRVGIGVPVGGGGSRLPEGRTTPEGNHRAIEAELKEKGLPETSAWEPVAGYLYFSVPKKKKSGYELVYMAGDKKVVLPLK
jgi:hypothetical protein